MIYTSLYYFPLGEITLSADEQGLIGACIPCHRVIGTNGKLCGYAGGIERKQTLLKIEKTAKLNKTTPFLPL